MVDIQKQFEQFHNTIRTDFEMNSTLREKRDILFNKVRKYLIDNKLPLCERKSQGSYKMKTGVVPIEGLEYDIDVGLCFSFEESAYTAKVVRGWVFDAIKNHPAKSVDEKGPCIRVIYADGYHVDLVTYCSWIDASGEDQYRLAHKTRGWVGANPIKLIEYVNNARKQYEGTEDNITKTDQFRRCVRALRRWNDVAIPYEDKNKPTGLALVLLAINHMTCCTTWDGKSNDRLALENLSRIVANTIGRIVVEKPTPEYEDMFGRLSEREMDNLKARFQKLHETLVEANNQSNAQDACKLLQDVFGDDFPVPPKEETAEKTGRPAIITTSTSA
jgi:hypothetical protein